MKISKKRKMILGVTCITLVSALSFGISKSVASEKASGWKKYDFRTESCVFGRSTCIIP